jgi:predicted acyl esterase
MIGFTNLRRNSPACNLLCHVAACRIIDRYVVERGWVVLVPLRRGRGQSEGTYQESYQ